MIQPLVPQLLPGNTIAAGFTTRHGGVSLPPFDSLNFGRATRDDPQAVANNHDLFYRYLDIDESDAAFMEQVHGDCVRTVDRGGVSPGTDGLVTATPGIALCVKTADCIPLLLLHPESPAIAAVHCGWRPIVSDIAERAVAVVSDTAGSTPDGILAVMGPSAGPCCYKIGEDLAERLHPDAVIYRNGSLFADLRTELKRRLMVAGIREGRIEIVRDCTIHDKTMFYSHRRDGGLSGRMIGYVMIKTGIK